MLNAIAAPVADPSGYVVLSVAAADTADGETRRRVNRIATLDGGAVFNDAGYSEADRVIDLRWAPDDLDIEMAVLRLVKLYARLTVATRHGVYLTAPEVYQPGDRQSQLRLLVVEKLSA